jgi:hypothetical protein
MALRDERHADFEAPGVYGTQVSLAEQDVDATFWFNRTKSGLGTEPSVCEIKWWYTCLA